MRSLIRAVIVAVAVLGAVGPAFAQNGLGAGANVASLEQQQKLEGIVLNRAAYVSEIVVRWEPAAKEAGRWDDRYEIDMTAALMKLQPANLLAAYEATSFKQVMMVLATGSPGPVSRIDVTGGEEPALGAPVDINALGDLNADLVFTPLAPCRIVDTRAGSPIAAGGTRTFDADGSSFTAQGGSATSCGVPYGAARAVAMTVTVTAPASWGWITAWGLGTMPASSSVLNYAAGNTLANTTVVPIVPGAGSDFSIYSYAATHVIIDVVGYYAAPIATALDCVTTELRGTGTANVLDNTQFGFPVPAACTAGYTIVSIACTYAGSSPAGLALTQEGGITGPGGWHACIWRNQTGTTLSASTFGTVSRCCRIPGR